MSDSGASAVARSAALSVEPSGRRRSAATLTAEERVAEDTALSQPRGGGGCGRESGREDDRQRADREAAGRKLAEAEECAEQRLREEQEAAAEERAAERAAYEAQLREMEQRVAAAEARARRLQDAAEAELQEEASRYEDQLAEVQQKANASRERRELEWSQLQEETLKEQSERYEAELQVLRQRIAAAEERGRRQREAAEAELREELERRQASQQEALRKLDALEACRQKELRRQREAAEAELQEQAKRYEEQLQQLQRVARQGREDAGGDSMQNPFEVVNPFAEDCATASEATPATRPHAAEPCSSLASGAGAELGLVQMRHGQAVAGEEALGNSLQETTAGSTSAAKPQHVEAANPFAEDSAVAPSAATSEPKPEHGSSAASITRDSATSTAVQAPADPCDTSGQRLHYEGWLAKRTSAKVAARWQRRYFVLDGYMLRYFHTPSGLVKKAFDLRKAKAIGAALGQPRELDLNFGVRVWRLRAESPEAARRWLLMLDAGQLMVGALPLGDGDDRAAGGACSDDDETGSEISTDSTTSSLASARSAASSIQAEAAALEPRRASQGAARSLASGPAVPAIVERLEVDPDELDKKFAAWLPAVGLAAEPGAGAVAADGRRVRSGLEGAFGALWTALSAPAQAAEPTQGPPAAAAEASFTAALAEVRAQSAVEVEALAEAVEGLLSEYLSRVHKSLTQWVQDSDPPAAEVADVAQWLLFRARAQLEQLEAAFQAAGHGLGSVLVDWRRPMEAAERSLLNEWESRRCSEVARQCSAAFDCSGGSVRRSGLALEILRSVMFQEAEWRGHTAAADRATSVLLTCLNALLRAFRAWVQKQSLVPTEATPQSGQHGHHHHSVQHRFDKVVRDLSKRVGCGAVLPLRDGGDIAVAVASGRGSLTSLVEAVIEACGLADFCAEASKVAGPRVRAEVLATCAASFEKDAAALCAALAKGHFARIYHEELNGAHFHAKGGGAPGGSMAGAVDAADGFLEELFHDAPKLSGALACDATVRVLLESLVEHLRRAGGTTGFAEQLQSEKAELQRLTARWGCKPPDFDFGQSLHEAVQGPEQCRVNTMSSTRWAEVH